jgi:hypothetical protein
MEEKIDELFFPEIEAQAAKAREAYKAARGASDGWEPPEQVEPVQANPGTYLGKRDKQGGRL